MLKRREPAVISLHLLRTAVESTAEEEAAEDPLGPLAVARPPILLEDATKLRLSFRGLIKIANLSGLRSLRKLQLDNNAITVIEGLECLGGTLEWLDLSFNAIEKISGLDSLSKLTDLSLFSNKISAAEGLDGCVALQVLSLGNNELADLMRTVIYLRTLPALVVLALSGNALCKAGDGGRDVYHPAVHAFCPRLEYLDYELITDAERLAAREGGVPADKLAEVEEADVAAAQAAKKAADRRQQLKEYTAANIEVSETIIEDIFGDDTDWLKLKNMPNMTRLIFTFREAVELLSVELRKAMEKNAQINEEISQFSEACLAETAAADEKLEAAIQSWEALYFSASTSHKTRLEAVAAASTALHTSPRSSSSLRAAFASAEAAAAVTANALRALDATSAALVETAIQDELHVHENIESMLDLFDSSLGELRASKLAMHEVFFRGVEAANTAFSEVLVKEALALFESPAQHKDVDEELASLLADRESLLGALLGANEARVARVLKREAELRAREEKRCVHAVTNARVEEHARNRRRIQEVKEIGAANLQRIESALEGVEGTLLAPGNE